MVEIPAVLIDSHLIFMNVADVTQLINLWLPEPHAGLLAGILFGSKATLSTGLTEALITTGTLHIVALSGTNITIVTTLVALVLLRFVSKRLASLLTIFIIMGYIWFVGLSPSVIRAGLMGCLALMATTLGKQRWPIWFWTLAVVIMLVLNPLWIVDLSFLLSVMATLGIILYGGSAGNKYEMYKKTAITAQSHNSSLDILASNQHKISFKIILSAVREFISEELRLTLAAQVFTIPILLFSFHRVSLISPVANIAIGWAIAPITALGFVMVLVGSLSAPLGQLLAWPIWLLIQYVVTVIYVLAKVPYASLQW